MELRHFEFKDFETKWADIASFTFPHFSARLTFTANWDQKFTIFVTLWQKPDKEFSYTFDDYSSAIEMMKLLYNTNQESFMVEKNHNVDKSTDEEKKQLRQLLNL